MVRPLTKELQKIAIEELHEDPEMVEEDIKNIQEWIKQQPHLNAQTDKQWILGFLRGCKFSYEKAKSKLDMYYTAKSLIPEIARPRNVFSTEVQTLLKTGMVLPLPYPKDYKGSRIILLYFKNKDIDTNIINVVNLTTLISMIMNILIVEDDNLIISGYTFWVDMTGYPFRLLLQMTPTYFKNFLYCMEQAVPLRMKNFLITGYPTYAEKVINIFKLCLTPKLRKRLFIHSDDNFENMFNFIPKMYMPKEYGGENSSTEDIAAYWKNKVESYSDWFTESEQYFINEALRPERPVSLDSVIGIDGSFRKLNID